MLSKVVRSSLIKSSLHSMNRALSSAIPSYLLNIPQVEMTTLPNGVRVASQGGYGQTSSVGVFIDAGSRYETEDKNGVAHYVEHLNFKGTNRRSRTNIEKEIEDLGAHLNAYTSREQTVYYSSCFSKDIGQVVDLLGDILLHSKFDPAAVNNERHTILLEVDDVFKNKYEVVFDLIHSAAFDGCGLAFPILGPNKNIQKIVRNDLVDYVQTHYTAPRVVIAGAGAVNHQYLVEMAEKTFGTLPSKPANGAIVPPITKTFNSAMKTIKDSKYPFCATAIGFETPGWISPYSMVFMVLDCILGSYDRMSESIMDKSVWYSRLAKDEVVRLINNVNISYKDVGLLGVYTECDKEKVPKAMEIIMDTFVHLKDDITEEQVELAKNRCLASLLMGPDGSSGVVDDLGRQILVYGRKITPAEVFTRINAITLKHVREVIDQYIINKPVAVGSYGPIDLLPPIEWFRDKLRV